MIVFSLSLSFSLPIHRLCAHFGRVCNRLLAHLLVLAFVQRKMQEIYNKNKCQHIGEWKSNYMDKTMQIRTHIVFHSQLASHKNITVFHLENKACITHNKQTMRPRIDFCKWTEGLQCSNVHVKTKTTTTEQQQQQQRKKEPDRLQRKAKHEPTHKWAPFAANVLAASISVFLLTPAKQTQLPNPTSHSHRVKRFIRYQALSMRVQNHSKASFAVSFPSKDREKQIGKKEKQKRIIKTNAKWGWWKCCEKNHSLCVCVCVGVFANENSDRSAYAVRIKDGRNV